MLSHFKAGKVDVDSVKRVQVPWDSCQRRVRHAWKAARRAGQQSGGRAVGQVAAAAAAAAAALSNQSRRLSIRTRRGFRGAIFSPFLPSSDKNRTCDQVLQ